MKEHNKDILFKKLNGHQGDLGEITLNRPKALNALTQNMCTQLREQLIQWEKDPHIKAVIIKSTSDRAFCAGGDIRKLHELKHSDKLNNAISFFQEEYSMNAAIYHFNKPYISFLNGITMGGGAGISIHGSHRIATENFIFAMPESGIGFFTDIGASHFLSRCPNYTGFYLALTGNTIHASDALHMGLITQIVSSQALAQIEEKLLTTPFGKNIFSTVTSIINEFHIKNNETEIWQHRHELSKCFQQNSVEDIITDLNQSEDAFFHRAASIMEKRSPTSLKVIFEQLHRAEQMEFDRIMQMDYTLAQHFLYCHDFYEGIRAALIDKDQHPQWKPNQLSDITNDQVMQFFK